MLVTDFAVATASRCVHGPNQDRALVVRDLGLFLIADGVSAGPTSTADCALAALARSLAACNTGEPDEQRLEAAVCEANRAVSEHVLACGPGGLSTVAALWTRDRDVVLAHVGQCRISRVRASGVSALTRDHTLLNEFARGRPEATAEEVAAAAVHANTLTRALGISETVTVDVARDTPERGDVYLLSTDGIHQTLSERATVGIVMSSESIAQTAKALVDRALAAGAMDDTTCVLVRVL